MKIENIHINIIVEGIIIVLLLILMATLMFSSCEDQSPPFPTTENLMTKEILSGGKHKAISYGGYRTNTRDDQPSVQAIKEDMRILSALNIKIIRTYNVKLEHASNVLKAIRELKEEDHEFQMYVMLGAWIDCKNAWTEEEPDHEMESEENAAEIDRAVALANQYPDIVKIIAVGNEAMVKWATTYYVQPGVILKWVRYLQGLKATNMLSSDVWITSSDNFASWGGGSPEYHVPELDSLIRAVDYISIHTYPMHDTHYNPNFWGVDENEKELSKEEKIQVAMDRATSYAKSQYEGVRQYVESLGIEKPIHIGETGWASRSDGFYGVEGSRACDEIKQAIYYKQISDWSLKEGITCFFFEAFDEPWKDAGNPEGSENHFGLFTVEGKAKYAIWDEVDEGKFQGLTRDGNPIHKSFAGNKKELFNMVALPPHMQN